MQAGEADPTLPFREALLLRNKEQGDLIRQQRQLEDDKRVLQSELATKRQCVQKLQARHSGCRPPVLKRWAWHTLHAPGDPGQPTCFLQECSPGGGRAAAALVAFMLVTGSVYICKE